MMLYYMSMNEPAYCDLLRERYAALRKQAEDVSRLIITAGVLNEPFIDAFRDFEEKKRELSELIEAYREGEAYFSFLQDLLFNDRNNKRIQNIFNKFEKEEKDGINPKFRAEKKALAHIFRCREDQIIHSYFAGQDWNESKEKQSIVYAEIDIEAPWDVTHGIAEPLSPDYFTYPKNMAGDLKINGITIIPEGVVLPERIGGDFEMDSLTTIPEEFTFPKYIGGHVHLPQLGSFKPKSQWNPNPHPPLGKNVVLPKYIGGGLDLHFLTALPEGFIFPEYIGGSINLIDLTDFPEEITFPKQLGGTLYLNEKLKDTPSLPAIPENIEVKWVDKFYFYSKSMRERS